MVSIGERFCTAAVEELKWGWACVKPRTFVEDVVEFNQHEPVADLEANVVDGSDGEGLGISAMDLENFFSNADENEAKDASREAVDAIKLKHGKVEWF